MPMAPELKKVRQELDYSFDEFNKIIKSRKFKTVFGDLDRSPESALSRPPKGYDDSNPAIEFLKLKSFIATTKISDADLTSKDLVKKIVGHFESLKPLIDFLNRAIEE
jgi:uncharacterized protein (TIGR02453 family)